MSSDAYNPNFIGCLVEIALKHAASFRLDSSAIGLACLNSLQQSFGIILLEEYLALSENGKGKAGVDDDGDESESRGPAMKRLKLSGARKEDQEAVIWIELAKLYRSMNDYDSIKGIFTKKKRDIVTKFTKDGFEFESNNDYYQV